MKRDFRWIFVGSNGIRAGWRLLIWAAILAAVIATFNIAGHLLHVKVPKQGVQLEPWMVIGEVLAFGFLLVASFVMSKIERRPMGVYGLPLRQALNGDVWKGALFGFASISAVLLCIYAMHGFQIDGLTTTGLAAFEAALLWGIFFLFVGFVEEFMFRGYVQYTLTSGTRFWVATLVTSALFGLAHFNNNGEVQNPIGLITVVEFGLFLCLVLRQTGNLWMCVGIHLGWDWGESFFYGVPDSGTTTWHAFIASSFHGPVWLTGGSVGPEGSIFTVIGLVVMAAVIYWRYPKPRYETRAVLVPAGGS